MRIRKGEWYRSTDTQGEERIVRASSDFNPGPGITRVIVRDAKPPRRIKPSEALAWLTAQPGWCIGDTSRRDGSVFVKCDSHECPVYGPAITAAIIALRKAMGVK